MKKQKAISIVSSYRSLDGVRIKFDDSTKRTQPYKLVIWLDGVEASTKAYEVGRGDLRKYSETDFSLFVQQCLDNFRKN